MNAHWRPTGSPALAAATSALLLGLALPVPTSLAASGTAEGELQVEIVKKGLGKEVSIKKGAKEWYMLIEVTPDNTVVIRQEKENDTYLVDESETHDRAMSTGEVDAAIEDFITAVKTQAKGKR
jgi:hypothetical protein